MAATTIPRHATAVPTLFFGGGDEVTTDGCKYNPTVIQFLRDDWAHKQIQSREAEYTEYRPVRVFVGTWNVNGKFPKDESIAPWLTDGIDTADSASMPDVYVLGLQEMVDLSPTNVTGVTNNSSKRSKEWSGLVESVLGRDNFELVGSRYLVGVLVAVFIKKKYRPYVTEVQDAIAAVGVMGVMGNKGGAALRFRLFDTTFCFLSAHLAAHRGAVTQRNSDFHAINSKMEFRDEAREAIGGTDSSVGAEGGGGERAHATYGVFEHDFLIWFGDFNYRIAEPMATDRVFELAQGAESALETLRRADQLNTERAAGRAFAGFREGLLSFRPTYKFQVGTSTYDQRPEKKVRPPAWCDRILWRVAPTVSSPRHFRQLYYGSVESLMSSDHKPVHALFEVAAKTTIRERRRAVLADVATKLSEMENATTPKLRLSSSALHADSVVYGVPLRTTMTVTNMSDVAAPWRVLPKPEEKVLCKTWLTVEPPFGLLPPGESVDLEFTILLDDGSARDVSLGRELAAQSLSVAGSADPAADIATEYATRGALGLLEELLVLRVERGRDIYLPVSAVVLPSAWGASLAQLARRPEPMRAIAATAASGAAINAAGGAGVSAARDASAGSRALLAALNADEKDADAPRASSDESRKGALVMSVPKEIWRLVDALVSRPGAIATPGLFIERADAADAMAVREAIDTGSPLPPSASALTVAATLLSLLRALREPLIPTRCMPSDSAALGKPGAIEAWSSAMLRALTPVHYSVLVYVVRFIREVIAAGPGAGWSSPGAGPSRADEIAEALSRSIMRRERHVEAPAHALHGLTTGEPRAVGDEETGATDATADFADGGTAWEPTSQEQEAMTMATLHLLTAAQLGP